METAAIILTLAAFVVITVSTWRKAIKAIQQYNKIVKRTKADQEEKEQAREFIKNFAKGA